MFVIKIVYFLLPCMFKFWWLLLSRNTNVYRYEFYYWECNLKFKQIMEFFKKT
jgi:hypothetical protein